ncbi:WSSV464 [White spot syndrome virus]|nr:WSSV464 [Shrimp white spot syndrome virus]AFX59782.1 wsv405 [White spot syndrome virus]
MFMAAVEISLSLTHSSFSRLFPFSIILLYFESSSSSFFFMASSISAVLFVSSSSFFFMASSISAVLFASSSSFFFMASSISAVLFASSSSTFLFSGLCLGFDFLSNLTLYEQIKSKYVSNARLNKSISLWLVVWFIPIFHCIVGGHFLKIVSSKVWKHLTHLKLALEHLLDKQNVCMKCPHGSL